MWLSDRTIEHLREIAEGQPDFSGTRYRIVGEIARGGMGIVYQAVDEALNRDVAVKVLGFGAASTVPAEQILREARVLARLEHPGIIPVHDVGELPDGRVYYAMKLVRGKTLSELPASAHGIAELLRVFLRICEAVAFANAHGVVHRDLKPDNVMIGAFGEVLVMDWGAASLTRSIQNDPDEPPPDSPLISLSSLTDEAVVVGTPGFMAPEQERPVDGSFDSRTDVYGLGAILRHLMSEYHSARRGELERRIPRPLVAIWRKAMADEPAERYADAAALGEDVTRYLDDSAVSAYRESIPEQASRWISRHRTAVSVIVAYLLMRMILFAWFGR